MRFMITHNQINPKCYMVSKVDDTTPAGLVKLTFKQDEYNPKRDNPNLFLCDYYNNSGDIVVDGVIPESSESTIKYMIVNEDGELEEAGSSAPTLEIGKTYYFESDGSDWRITVIGEFTDEERLSLEKLITIRNVNDTTISLRPGKSNRIKGMRFNLSSGADTGAIILEVAE